MELMDNSPGNWPFEADPREGMPEAVDELISRYMATMCPADRKQARSKNPTKRQRKKTQIINISPGFHSSMEQQALLWPGCFDSLQGVMLPIPKIAW
jgi:hypothetical protein